MICPRTSSLTRSYRRTGRVGKGKRSQGRAEEECAVPVRSRRQAAVPPGSRATRRLDPDSASGRKKTPGIEAKKAVCACGPARAVVGSQLGPRPPPPCPRAGPPRWSGCA